MRILILSYHFPPFNVIASYRAKAFADYLPQYGHEVTVITHPWKDIENDIVLETRDNLRIIRIPRDKLHFGGLFKVLNKIPIIRTLSHYIFLMFGFLDGNNVMFDFYYLYKKHVNELLRDENFDVVLAIFSPYQHLKLAYELKRKYKIPYVLDFRDLYDNMILNMNYKPNLDMSIQNFLRLKYLRRWLKNSSFSTSTSKEWAEHLEEIGSPSSHEILNGFEGENFQNYSRQKTDIFNISYLGTIHAYQNWPDYLKGIEKFLISNRVQICLNFIGVSEDFKSYVKDWISNLDLPIQERIKFEIRSREPKSMVVDFFSKSSILLLPTLKDRVGMMSGKTLEYLASQVPILAYPDDNDVISKLIKETNAGFVVNSIDDISNKLESFYNEWVDNGITTSAISLEQIEQFTRENQVKKFAEILLEKVGKNG